MRNFRLFFCGYSTAIVGSAMASVALSFAVFQLGGGAWQVSEVLAGQSVPLVSLLLFGGVIADRFSRTVVMIAADILRCVTQALLAGSMLAGHATIPMMIILASLMGIGDAFFLPGRAGLIPQLVDADFLQAANGFASMARSAGSMIGPALGGIVVGSLGPSWAFVANSIGYAISASCLASIRVQPQVFDATHGLLRQLVDGWIEFRSRLWLWLTVLLFALYHLLVYGPLLVLGPLRYRNMIGGAASWGALLGALGAGALLGGLLAMRFRPRYPLRTALTLFAGVAFAPASLTSNVPFVLQLIAFFAAGLGIESFNVLWTTIMQRKIPPEALSRVTAYDLMGSTCLLPAGYMAASPLAAALGLDGALWLGAGFTVISTLLVLLPRGVRLLKTEAEAGTEGD